jgi:hypothetical protein
LEVTVVSTPGQLVWTAFYAFPILFSPAALAQVQTNAPVPEALSITPSSVNVSASDQHVQATLRVKYLSTDDVPVLLSGLFFNNPFEFSSLNAVPLSATPVACSVPASGFVCANFSYDLTVPQGFSPSGTYTPAVSLQWNRAPFFAYYDLMTLGITTTLLVSSGPRPDPTCTLPPPGPGGGSGGIADTTPPTLVAICLSSYTIDVRTAPQTVKLFLNVSDDLSGFSYGYVYFNSPSGTQSQSVYVPDSARTQGNALSGIYEVSVTIPAGAEPGDWTMFVSISDRVANFNGISMAGNPSKLTVVSVPDVNPPVVRSLIFAPSSVNVSSASQTVTVNIGLADDVSGVDLTSGRSYFYLTSPSGNQNIPVYLGGATLTSGTLNDGVWQTQVTMPRYSEPGAWKISSIGIYDVAGNQFSAFTGFGSPPPAINFTVASSPADVTPPSINSLNFNPTFVNTAASDQTIDVTLAVTDNLAGLYSTDFPGFYFANCFAYFISPSGQQSRYTGSVMADSPIPTSAVLKTTLVMPHYSEIGTWSLNYLTCTDLANNVVFLSKADAQSKHFPVDLIVIQPSQTVDGTVGPGGGTVQDQGSATSLSVPPGALSANTTVAIDVLAQPPAVPAPQGFSFGTVFVNLDLNPRPAGAIPAPGLTLVLPLESSRTPGSSLVLYRIDPVSGKLNPAPSVSGGLVTGIVGASGLTATFNGIASFSTVVGLNPPTRPGDLNADNVVNCADILIIRNSWGKRSTQQGFDPRADYNRDNVVNIFDLAAVSKYLPRGVKCN